MCYQFTVQSRLAGKNEIMETTLLKYISEEPLEKQAIIIGCGVCVHEIHYTHLYSSTEANTTFSYSNTQFPCRLVG